MRLLGVGRLVDKKGFDVLVEACGELDRRGVPFEAVIAGPDDAAGPALRARIGELGLGGRIHLAGQMSQAELLEQYRRATAFCLPCRVLDDGDRDGIPNVLVEAMAAGTPVVTTAISGIPEIVRDGATGCSSPPTTRTRWPTPSCACAPTGRWRSGSRTRRGLRCSASSTASAWPARCTRCSGR